MRAVSRPSAEAPFSGAGPCVAMASRTSVLPCAADAGSDVTAAAVIQPPGLAVISMRAALPVAASYSTGSSKVSVRLALASSRTAPVNCGGSKSSSAWKTPRRLCPPIVARRSAAGNSALPASSVMAAATSSTA